MLITDIFEAETIVNGNFPNKFKIFTRYNRESFKTLFLHVTFIHRRTDIIKKFHIEKWHIFSRIFWFNLVDELRFDFKIMNTVFYPY